MTEITKIKQRPRSPHVSIYRWTITMAMSIAHRITGIALYFGMVFLAIWLISISCGVEAFRTVHRIYTSFPGLCILFLYTLAGIHHMVGGVRHIVWDIKPCLLAKEKATMTAWATVFISLIITFTIWIIGYNIV
ncbi:succinate dehydrogenase, cytochrome b556 subunit [Bartonella henselae]|uniref:Succinate dehydrogenase cytochrome b556 subunit n=1 Tax=Bartonella henselae (strain ATCC 49882 / DSM 28221 / CCUG 30454 / Houston 1) TaxID=283166 RepID=A0A0H3M4S2_BARHE|nr:succinate dehydrogenase, cytochrome b556 subunit [Bartonella henselae]ATP13182.1 succinate dehydrogenase, cytochrome b556 subunit [Bartonella henselae]ETS04185.1 succinate dehydrogenase, cytochrome b556 subunit [Bartonella henselae JK 50]ETS05013.1 succinate dehydrogenase, cytochrome b556 subunit [Bartonella henselae JK 51]MDM9990275.1 succinate dehydrogenase, cytochrome b556 subunit [Bartonella henselae]OLL42532.1 succinate dehydrogenase [Bartonella henselae]